jgi:hypothetical protein
MSTETKLPYGTTCVIDNCPAYWTGLKWAVPDDDRIPDSVLEHQHVTAGGETYRENTVDEPVESCDGNAGHPERSLSFEEALSAANNYLVARKEYEEAYRELIGRSLLVPARERDDLAEEILKAYRRHGFSLPTVFRLFR